jgi:hypothetical protein
MTRPRAAAERHDIVVVAADVTGRSQARRDLQTLDLGNRPRQKRLLHPPRDVQLVAQLLHVEAATGVASAERRGQNVRHRIADAMGVDLAPARAQEQGGARGGAHAGHIRLALEGTVAARAAREATVPERRRARRRRRVAREHRASVLQDDAACAQPVHDRGEK